MSDYHKSCGPAVAASVLGIPRPEAAARLRQAMYDVGAKRVAKGTYTTALLAVFKAAGVNAEWTVYKKKDRSTLRQWAAAHQVGEYITIAADHAIHWKDGIAVEANGVPMAWRGKVVETLRIVPPEVEAEPVPEVEPETAVSIGSGAYTGIAVEQHRGLVWVVDIMDKKGNIVRPPGWLRADDLQPLERSA